VDFQFSPLFFLFALSAVIPAGLAVFVWFRRRTPGGVTFFFLLLNLTWWLLTAAAEAGLQNPSHKILASEFQYFSITSIAPLFFLFSLRYRERMHRLPPFLRILLWIPPPVIVILAFTNSAHHWVWRSIVPMSDRPGAILVYSHGPAVWANLLYAYGLILAATFLLLGIVFQTRGPAKRQAAWIIPGVLAPWLGNVVYMFHWGPPGVDLTPLAFTLTGIFLAHSLFRYQLLDIVPVAYGSIVDNMTDAVVVLDEKSRLIGINPAARRLLASSREDYGQFLEKILRPWPEFAERIFPLLQSVGYRSAQGPMDSRWMDIRIFDIPDSRGRMMGRFLIFRDVTESRTAEEERTQTLDRIRLQQQSIVRLSLFQTSARGDFAAAASEITETAARTLGLERVSIWLGSAKEGRIRCADLFENSRNSHSEGHLLLADHFPRYFEALARDRAIDAQDAQLDPRTREFAESYLRPLGIGALLDAPIRMSGVMIGIVCCEHVGPARRWMDDEIRFAGEIADAAAHAYATMEKKLTDEAHLESETRFRMLVEGAPDAIFVQAAGGFAYLNAAAVKLFGADSPERLLGRPVVDRFHPDYRDRILERIRMLNEEKKAVPRMEEVYLRLDGSAVDVEVSAVPILYRELDGALVYIRDITERKKSDDALRASLREKEVLLREVQHRVRNNMQIISSLLNHQASALADPAMREAFRASQNRIKSIALIHEKLYRSGDLSRIDFADYIQSLVVHLFHVYRIDLTQVQYVLDLEPINLDVNVSIPLGLIVNELVLNAIRHGFPKKRTGEVIVRLAKNDDDGHTLQIRDNGVGIPGGVDLEKVETLGLQIVRMLVDQIDGTVLIETPPGTSVTVRFRGRDNRSWD
jgi:PAS domain S-box-containing protein